MEKMHCFIEKCYKKIIKKWKILEKKREIKVKTIKIKITKTQKFKQSHICYE